MEHDSPTLLFNLAREYLLAAKVIRPGPIVLARLIGSARKAAGDLTSQLMAPALTAESRADCSGAAGSKNSEARTGEY